MKRFLPISNALAEAAALQGRRPTAEQYAMIEDILREHMVFDFDAGAVAISYDDCFVVNLAEFVANRLTYPDIEVRSAPGATLGF